MAGDRQHYLPQFLQRGFESSPHGKQTWLFRKDAAPRLVGIRDVGVEQSFYSEAGDRAIDETITDAESLEFSRLVNAARESEIGAILEGDFARLVAHLEVRTRHLRQSFLQISEDLWRKTVMKFQEPEFLKRLLERRLTRKVSEELRRRGIPANIVDTLLKESVSPESLKALCAQFPSLVEQIIVPQLRLAAKQGHLKALTKSISPEVRSSQYEQLTFRSHHVTTKDMILGDSAVVFQIASRESLRPLVDKGDVVVAAILPISSGRVLIGSNVVFQLEPQRLRQQIASCSLEFFTAAENSSANAKLATDIAKSALPLSAEDIEEMIGQAIEEHLN
jgi:hypothetical protein